jgi:hypothetical protein
MAIDAQLLAASEAYLDGIFGPGAGKAHTQFLARLGNPPLEEALHRAHAQQADQRLLSVTEHYLIGICVLCATKGYAPAAMFAKTLRHLGVSAEKIREAVARLAIWIGPVPAAEAAGHVGKAIAEYERDGLRSLAAWFPEAPGAQASGEGTGAQASDKGGAGGPPAPRERSDSTKVLE